MRLFFAIIIALSSAFTFRSGAEFYFLEKNHDFTDVKEGEVISYDFEFTNSGNQPIIISGYEVNCSCTKLTFPKEPILPNKKGILHLTFDSEGKYGYQSRKIEIISNALKKTKISFRVFVVRK